MNLVERINIKIKENSMSMRQLEQKAGIANGNISHWNERKPSYDKVVNVANALNVSINWLITGKDSEDLTPEEQKLIDTFRGCSPIGQDLIQEQAEAIREKLPAEHDEQPAGVSTSAIG